MNRDFEFESVFFQVIEDLKDYLDGLTVVGGWLAYIYPRFLWNNFTVHPVITMDIDFGVNQRMSRVYKQTIFQILSSLDYKERHVDTNRMYPVVLFKEGRIRIDFISPMDISVEVVEKMVGIQMSLNKIQNFDFLLNNTMTIAVTDKQRDKTYPLLCPKPSAFIYHKSAIFVDREDELKQAKDLFYIYFVLRYASDIDSILNGFRQYYQKGEFPQVVDNLKKYFQRLSSPGCLMVEKENGPDEFINDLRSDIFERFQDLIAQLT